jgi:hypothetical protein
MGAFTDRRGRGPKAMISDMAQSVTQGVLTTQSPAEEVLAPNAQAGLARGVWAVAAAVLAVELLVSGRYGFHRDELYFIVAGRHPALGYVDMPPLAPLLARVATWAFGLSPEAVRVLPALAGAATAAGAGFTARLLGGRAQAQVLAALATGAAPVLLAADHLAGTTPYDLLAWTVAVASVLATTRSGRSQAWLVAGLALGLGLENKDLPLLLVLSAAVGILAFGPPRSYATATFGPGRPSPLLYGRRTSPGRWRTAGLSFRWPIRSTSSTQRAATMPMCSRHSSFT